MTANVNAMVRAGVDAYRAGKRSEARTLLERAIELDEQNEQAWLWLSAVVDSTDDQITCLQNVLVINPQNDRARQGLRSLGVDPGPESAPAATPEPDYPSAPAFETGTYDDYVVPSSSASVSGNNVPAISTDDYDAWMENLNLGGPPEAEPAPQATTEDDPFAATTDDIFGDVDFSSEADDLFGDDDPFGDVNFNDTSGNQDLLADTDVYTDDYDDVLSSTSVDDGLLDLDDGLDDLLGGADDLLFEDDLLADPSPTPEASFGDDDLLSDAPGSYQSPTGGLRDAVAGYVSKIPPEIPATRMPGMDAEVPQTARILTGVLAFLNVAAVGFVIFAAFRLTT